MLTLLITGIKIKAKIPNITITANNSINVNPFFISHSPTFLLLYH